MIEVNLLGQKKPFKLPVLLGVDLAEVNFKFLILAFIINSLPEYLVYPEWAEDLKVVNAETQELEVQLRKIKKEIRGNDNVKKQLDAFNAQVERLKQRSAQVDRIIKTRTNPGKILERLARNIPDDMWLDNVEVTNEKKIVINGFSSSYKSIGNFIVLANESSFFGKTLTLTDSKTVKESEDEGGRRVESFNIQGNIESYDPWNQ